MISRLSKYMVIAAIIVGLILAAIYIPVAEAEGNIEGAPEVGITAEIKKVVTETTISEEEVGERTASAEIDAQEGDSFIGLFRDKSKPLSTIEVGVPFVEPDAFYEITFKVDVTAIPESPAVVNMAGSVNVTGKTTELEDFDNDRFDYFVFGSTKLGAESNIPSGISPGDVTTFELPTLDSIARKGEISQNRLIRGKYLHDSEFNITASYNDFSDPSIFGLKSVNIIIKVGAGGDIDLVLSNISATVS